MKCKNCNSTNLEIVESGPHKKLVCVDCLKFQKFLNEKDVDTFNQINKEVIKPKIIKGNEVLFNKFTELSYKIKKAAAIVQNDMEISEEDKDNFTHCMSEIRTNLDNIEQDILDHIDSSTNKYNNFVGDLLKNTKALNEKLPWN